MSVKLTESGVATLLKTLNSLICEEGLLTTEQRQNMVMTVATLGALGERVRQSIEDKAARKAARAEKKPREPDPIFPKAGTPWSDDELLRNALVWGAGFNVVCGISDQRNDRQTNDQKVAEAVEKNRCVFFITQQNGSPEKRAVR